MNQTPFLKIYGGIHELLQGLRVMAFSKGTFYEEQHGLDLRHRIFYTVLFLLLFRFLAAIPVLNVDEVRLQQLLADNPLVGTVDLFAGGEVLTHFSVVAAGIFPYLLALVLAHGAIWIVPSLRELRYQEEQYKKKIEFITKLLTIPLAFIFAWAISQYLSQQTGLFPEHIHWFTMATFFSSLRIVCFVTVGSLLSTWIIHRITKIGVGSGEGIVLLAGASLGLVKQFVQIVHESSGSTDASYRLGFVIVGGLIVIVLSYYLAKAQRRIPIIIPKKSSPHRDYGQKPYLPFLLNIGGILPVSAAMGLLTLLQFAQIFLKSHFGGILGAVGQWLSVWLTPASGLYWISLAFLIVLFTYAYNFSIFWNEDIPMALKKSGLYIPDVRPGKTTEKYLSGIMTRITWAGALGLALLAAGLPYLILLLTQQNVIVTILSLMVVVKTIVGFGWGDKFEAYYKAKPYEPLMKKASKK